ncbi:hypothetical protein AUJ84_03895 [Candidatus Pacearchaeota archaeon CG1_02_32_132]|nr:MAG: hypothetical protein AUJ84_03895 [Candidatus Pacearchaeota archaeon CG1_02_32_132]
MISWFEKHNKISWAITIILAITIFYVSSLQFAPSSGPGGQNSKATLYHLTIFFIFAIFLFISLVQGMKKKEDLIFLGIIIVVGYAFLDEFHQLFVPTRSGSLFDVLLDVVGISVAAMGYFVVVSARKK